MSEPTNSTWKIEFPPFDLRALLRLGDLGLRRVGRADGGGDIGLLDRGIAPRGRGGATRRCANLRDHGPTGDAGGRHGERDPTPVRDGAGAHRRSRPAAGARCIARAQPRGRHGLDQAAGRRRAWPAYSTLVGHHPGSAGAAADGRRAGGAAPASRAAGRAGRQRAGSESGGSRGYRGGDRIRRRRGRGGQLRRTAGAVEFDPERRAGPSPPSPRTSSKSQGRPTRP